MIHAFGLALDTTVSSASPASSLIGLAIAIVVIAGLWRVFAKAGQPGWAAIIPIYSTIVLLRIAGRPWWWLLLLLVPVANLIVAIMALNDVARAFGKGVGFTIGLILLSPIFFCILGFGSAQYQGSSQQQWQRAA